MIQTKQFTFYLKDMFCYVRRELDEEVFLHFVESGEAEFGESVRICATEAENLSTCLRRAADVLDNFSEEIGNE